MSNDIPLTQETAEDDLHHTLINAIEYLGGDELAMAADALVVKNWACIEQNSERSHAAAIALNNLIEALDLYIKSKHE